MYGVILAAGMAKRLRPLTDHCPKCLLKIGNRSLLWRALDALKACGISEYVIVTGYKADMIHEEVRLWHEINKPSAEDGDARQQAPLHFCFLHNADYENNNNIFSLWMAGEIVRGKEFLLLDSDILLDPQLVKRISQEEGSALAMNRHELGEEEMKVVVDEHFRITELSKTCRIEDAIGESVGVEKISAQYSSALYDELDTMINNENLIDVFYEMAFERLIPKGWQFKVVDTTDYFSMELDTPDDFQNAKDNVPQHLL